MHYCHFYVHGIVSSGFGQHLRYYAPSTVLVHSLYGSGSEAKSDEGAMSMVFFESSFLNPQIEFFIAFLSLETFVLELFVTWEVLFLELFVP